jgi:hypothetical protein
VDAGQIAELTAAACSSIAAGAALASVVILKRRVQELATVALQLANETVPLVRDARIAADHAASEMVRVGEVLGSAEAVTATVDSASRLAYRVFSNPAVKALAFGSGLRGASRRMVTRGASRRRASGRNS